MDNIHPLLGAALVAAALWVLIAVVWFIGRTAIRSFRGYVRNLWPH